MRGNGLTRGHSRRRMAGGARRLARCPVLAPAAAGFLGCVSSRMRIHAMRTTIVIDDKLMKDTLRATGLKTGREPVEPGLRALPCFPRKEDSRRFRDLQPRHQSL